MKFKHVLVVIVLATLLFNTVILTFLALNLSQEEREEKNSTVIIPAAGTTSPGMRSPPFLPLETTQSPEKNASVVPRESRFNNSFANTSVLSNSSGIPGGMVSPFPYVTIRSPSGGIFPLSATPQPTAATPEYVTIYAVNNVSLSRQWQVITFSLVNPPSSLIIRLHHSTRPI